MKSNGAQSKERQKRRSPIQNHIQRKKRRKRQNQKTLVHPMGLTQNRLVDSDTDWQFYHWVLWIFHLVAVSGYLVRDIANDPQKIRRDNIRRLQ